jgi:hypothetical protein
VKKRRFLAGRSSGCSESMGVVVPGAWYGERWDAFLATPPGRVDAKTRFHGIAVDGVMHPVAMHFVWRAALRTRLS